MTASSQVSAPRRVNALRNRYASAVPRTSRQGAPGRRGRRRGGAVGAAVGAGGDAVTREVVIS
jgi:hypothetical protein